MNNLDNLFKPFPELETERCILSLITKKNLKDVFKLYSNPEIMKYMQIKPLERKEEALSLIYGWNNLLNENNGIRWGMFLKANPGILIGTIALHYWKKSSNCIELGADLLKDYWGKGFAYECTRSAIDFAYNKLEINRIELRCNPNNIAAIKIAEKFGFNFEGTLREYVYIEGRGYDDESVFSVLKKEYSQLN